MDNTSFEAAAVAQLNASGFVKTNFTKLERVIDSHVGAPISPANRRYGFAHQSKDIFSRYQSKIHVRYYSKLLYNYNLLITIGLITFAPEFTKDVGAKCRYNLLLL